MLGGYLPRAPPPSHYSLTRLPVGAYLLVFFLYAKMPKNIKQRVKFEPIHKNLCPVTVAEKNEP